jgi:hypothetical protein
MACSSKPWVSTSRWRFLPLISCPHRSRAGRSSPPFFAALDALAVDDGGRWAGLSGDLLAALHVKRMMDALQRTVPLPQLQIVMQGAARWQVLRDRPPLASSAEDVHQPVDHLAHVNRALVAAAPGGRDQRHHVRPFLVGQIARIAQLAAVVSMTVLWRPHRRPPPYRTAVMESQ